MKSKISLLIVGLLSLVVVGCGGGKKTEMMMMEMQDKMNMMEMQMNTVEASAATAKDMASEAMMMSGKNRSMMRKMHGSKMMK